MIKLECGDIIKMKKKHPCGSDEWEVIKVGADIKLKCCGCMHEIILKYKNQSIMTCKSYNYVL